MISPEQHAHFVSEGWFPRRCRVLPTQPHPEIVQQAIDSAQTQGELEANVLKLKLQKLA